MKSKVLVFILLFSMAVPAFHIAPAGAQGADWVISGETVVIDEDITLSRNLIVEGDGVLEIRNATVTYELDVDGSKGIEIKSGGKVTVTNAKITGKDSINTPVFKSFGVLTVSNSEVSRFWGKWPDGGGIQIMGGKATITGSRIHGNRRDAITVSGGEVTISDNTIDENIVGIKVKGSPRPVISGNIIKLNHNQGILSIDARPEISDNDITGNNVGIGLSGSDAVIKNNRIKNNEMGVDISTDSGANLDNNTIELNEICGITAFDSTPTIRNNLISGNSLGINLSNAKGLIEGNEIVRNGNGISCHGSEITLRDNKIGENNQFGIFVYSNLPIIEGTEWSGPNGNGRLSFNWRLEVEVFDDSEDPVDNATVTIRDSRKEIVWTGKTNTSGVTESVLLTDYIVDNYGDTVSRTPHTVTVSKDGIKRSIKIDMKEDKRLTAELVPEKEAYNPVFIALVIAGVMMLILAIGLGWHLKNKWDREKKPKPKMKRALRKSKRRRKGRSRR
jgi:parallel beta-helix repeat protein